MINPCIAICTKNNKKKLDLTLSSIIKLTNLPIVIVDQSTQKSNFPSQQIQYIWTPKKTGVSISKNIVLKKTSSFSHIIWFDDDAIPSLKFFENTKKLSPDSIIFGRTLPYKKSSEYSFDKQHPSVFTNNQIKNISEICEHWEHIGLGNNMITPTKIFKTIGPFKTWLGPGSTGLGGEDAEFIIRSLLHHIPIKFDPQFLVFHNKWLKGKAIKKQNVAYTYGGLAAYGFYAFQGIKPCQIIVKKELLNIAKNALIHPSSLISGIYSTKGLLLGFQQYKKLTR